MAKSFRAWDKDLCKYVTGAEFGLARMSIRPDEDGGHIFSFDTLFKGRYTWEQYTGLKDKNGEEIYEGDIIRCHGDDRFIAPVIRHDESGGFCWISCYKEECFIPEADEVEVIGNIHENKELLGGGKE